MNKAEWSLGYAKKTWFLFTDIDWRDGSRSRRLIDRGWSHLSAYDVGTFKTKDLNEAVCWRKFATPDAEKVFKNIYISEYELPTDALLHLSDAKGFQVEGVKHILSYSRTYLADDPGLGKTFQAIGAHNCKGGPALVICPPHLVRNWEREILKWSTRQGGLFESVEGLRESYKTSGVDKGSLVWRILPDSRLGREVREGTNNPQFRFVFIDEAHRFKEVTSQRTINLLGGNLSGRTALTKVKGYVRDVDHVVYLSGTPTPNGRSMELFPVLHTSAPEVIDFKSYLEFGYRYGNPRMDEKGRPTFTGSSNEKELSEKLFNKFMLRRTKDEVLRELPPKRRSIVFTDQSPLSKESHNFERKVLGCLDQKKIKLNEYQKFKQLGDYAKYRQEVGLIKAKWATEYVNHIVGESNQSMILFVHHRHLIQIMMRNLKKHKPIMFVGGLKDSEKQKAEDDFQNGKSKLFMASISACQLGLTLTKAKRVAFLEWSPVPEENRQAEDRAHRIGQPDSVLCDYLVTPGSLDERMLVGILRKQNSIDKLMGEK